MNKLFFILSLLSILSLKGYAQQDTIIYKTGNGKSTDREHATFYQEIQVLGKNKYRVSSFRLFEGEWMNQPVQRIKVMNDSLHRIGKYFKGRRINQIDRKFGPAENGLYAFKDFTKKGRLKQEGYTASKFPLQLEGNVKRYFKNGKISEEAFYEEGHVRTIRRWNRDGTPYLDNVFVYADTMPEFPGGIRILQQYIGMKTNYPQICQRNGITGKVFVDFVVMEDGSVKGVRLARGVDPYLDAEALRVVREMKVKWKPGVLDGKKVRVLFTVPVNFKLR